MPAIVITALSDSVAIVHIPINLTHVYSTKIYWTIDRSNVESSEFFNITSNKIEMAIFGSLELINHEWFDIIQEAKDEILISSSWRVFEISSGDQDEIGNYDSPHLRHVSAPLAKAGISIQYQSGYFTDFLLVKESDFEKARSIFANQGWQIDPSFPSAPKRRSLVSPLTPSHPSFFSSSPSPTRSTVTPEITVLPSPLACIGFSRSAESKFAERVRKFLVWPERYSSSIYSHSAKHLGDLQHEEEITCLKEEKPYSRPFISYTRNEDGSSLLTEIRILRNMFENDEDLDGNGSSDEMLLSGGELLHQDNYDEDENTDWNQDHCSYTTSENEDDLDRGRRYNDQRNSPMIVNLPESQNDIQGYEHSLPALPIDKQVFVDSDDEDKSEYSVGEIPIRWYGGKDIKGEANGRKRCLQLDLRCIEDSNENDVDVEGVESYHLGKSGLVNRFSDLLTSTSNPIRMLYSSTFHTANILVEAKDVKKAKKLLERKRRSIDWN
ncbi:uncharacterized protein L201_003281 [Kwoniella dendrophila CBS 6074]|uniref:CASTOR ACT domain-containing protein n=1 Tax=Kwoniella dendrophila CBS 6074 TaxID=1295534 RepID=A0AAX4JUY1_9TREE